MLGLQSEGLKTPVGDGQSRQRHWSRRIRHGTAVHSSPLGRGQRDQWSQRLCHQDSRSSPTLGLAWQQYKWCYWLVLQKIRQQWCQAPGGWPVEVHIHAPISGYLGWPSNEGPFNEPQVDSGVGSRTICLETFHGPWTQALEGFKANCCWGYPMHGSRPGGTSDGMDLGAIGSATCFQAWPQGFGLLDAGHLNMICVFTAKLHVCSKGSGAQLDSKTCLSQVSPCTTISTPDTRLLLINVNV